MFSTSAFSELPFAAAPAATGNVKTAVASLSANFTQTSVAINVTSAVAEISGTSSAVNVGVGILVGASTV